MLKTVDILIGATTVLLIFSMAVTVITQAITGIFNRKGNHLKAGLSDLLRQLGIADPKVAKDIAEKVLTHPMIAVGGRLGSVIHRDEFTRLLLDFGSGEGAATLKEDAQKALVDTLKKNGISDPAEAVKNIRDVALQIETSNPEIANHVRDGIAVLHGASSDFVARVNSWFDQCIDRVTERFTQYTHAVVVGVSLVVVLTVQLDILAVVNRLSIDDEFRNSIVSQATHDFSKTVTTSPAAQNGTPAAGTEISVPTLGTCQTTEAKQKIQKAENDARTDAQTKADADANIAAKKASDEAKATAKSANKSEADAEAAAKKAEDDAKAGARNKSDADVELAAKSARADAIAECQSTDPKPYYDLLNKAGLLTLPLGGGWLDQISELRKWPGMLLSVLLLSLGAPFWFGVLKQLLSLRSSLATKDDAQREQRQSTQSSSNGSVASGLTSAPNLPKGEAGNLGAAG